MKYVENIWDGSQIQLHINARCASLKICDRINQIQVECKYAELSAKIIGKGTYIT